MDEGTRPHLLGPIYPLPRNTNFVQCHVLWYSPNVSEVLSLSIEPLPSGDYGWFFPNGGSSIPSLRHLPDMCSFTTMQREDIQNEIPGARLSDPCTL
ncbi:uncharacterized protein BT62DRAFT_1075176, partial [Guyanagaster necrorhizus]